MEYRSKRLEWIVWWETDLELKVHTVEEAVEGTTLHSRVLYWVIDDNAPFELVLIDVCGKFDGLMIFGVIIHVPQLLRDSS